VLPHTGYIWTAPEHLRETTPSYSVKGDVYSFGIILYEIVCRSTPFSDVMLMPEGSTSSVCVTFTRFSHLMMLGKHKFFSFDHVHYTKKFAL
jgi:serine/threonine protein kinase